MGTPSQRRAGPGGGVGRLGAQLLAELDRAHVRALSFPDDWPLVDEVTGSRSASRSLVFRLARAGILTSIKRGAYAVRPRSGALALSALDLVGPVTRANHLVTAGKALEVHELTDQSFRTLYVLTATRQRPWSWQGERVRYVTVPPNRIWGGRELRAARHPTIVAGPERALIDGLAHPSWGVSLAQVAEATARALDDPHIRDRLGRAAARYQNAFLARRLGFIVSRLAGEQAAAEFRSLIGTSRAVALLDPRGPRTGPVHTEWRLRENVPFELLAAKGIQ